MGHIAYLSINNQIKTDQISITVFFYKQEDFVKHFNEETETANDWKFSTSKEHKSDTKCSIIPKFELDLDFHMIIRYINSKLI